MESRNAAEGYRLANFSESERNEARWVSLNIFENSSTAVILGRMPILLISSTRSMILHSGPDWSTESTGSGGVEGSLGFCSSLIESSSPPGTTSLLDPRNRKDRHR